ncbi:MAG: amidohydrolase family protein, partial [Armatimonadota bacterium]|nr:amidohydrolase family protein [Armatimonadota bacterium]
SAVSYAARGVLPMDAEPIEDGEVVVDDGLIVDVRLRRGRSDYDFGQAVILPGLVNAHTHLEYTALRGFLEDVPFFPWIRALTAAKASLTPDDWLWSTRQGALECLRAGITTIGDNADAGPTAQVAEECGLRGIVYQELFGIDDRELVGPIMARLAEKIAAHRRHASARVRVGVSPHALYTIRPALFETINAYVSAQNLPTSIHIAESPAESALTERGEGPFAEMYARRGITWQPPHVSPTQYAAQMGALTPQTLAVHCVHQSPEDTQTLARSQAAIVHCPKSNAKLGAGLAPLTRWLQTPGLRVALGTDSAVSNNTLDLFEEMRFGLLMQRTAQQQVDVVSARQMLALATLGGAQAMGLDAQIGSLTPGKRADLIAVRLDAPHTVPSTDPYAALVYSARADDVRLTLCDGVVLYEDGLWPTLDAPAVLRQVQAVRRRIEIGP